MLPREQDGVVDPNMIVYGTSNLRVVDASIFPIVRHRSRPLYLVSLADWYCAVNSRSQHTLSELSTGACAAVWSISDRS